MDCLKQRMVPRLDRKKSSLHKHQTLWQILRIPGRPPGLRVYSGSLPMLQPFVGQQQKVPSRILIRYFFCYIFKMEHTILQSAEHSFCQKLVQSSLGLWTFDHFLQYSCFLCFLVCYSVKCFQILTTLLPRNAFWLAPSKHYLLPGSTVLAGWLPYLRITFF